MFGRNYSLASTRPCRTGSQLCSRLRPRDPLLRLGIVATLLSSLVVSVYSTPTTGFASDSATAAALNWHHPPSHPVHKLFRRDADESLPPVGSDEWTSAYPSGVYDLSSTPQEWLDALNAVDSAGLIPHIPVSTVPSGKSPVYDDGNQDPSGSDICSATYECQAPGDVWDAPEGFIGIGFDDGPLLPSPALYAFLQNNTQLATHFMIGLNILTNPDIFLEAFNNEGDIAVHTWTHPYMTSLSNEAVLAELGWTMQIIHDSTGGRVPRFWRPPYGDADNRVRAIAKNVFGLTMIVWNQDTADWTLSTGGTTKAKVKQSLQKWINGPKSPGLIILEHELSDDSVECFLDAYPSMGEAGWNTTSVARLVPGYDGAVGQTYWNAPNGNGNGSIDPTDVLSGSSANGGGVSSGITSSSLAPGEINTQTTGGHVSGACRKARLRVTIWGYVLAAVTMMLAGI